MAVTQFPDYVPPYHIDARKGDRIVMLWVKEFDLKHCVTALERSVSGEDGRDWEYFMTGLQLRPMPDRHVIRPRRKKRAARPD